MAKGQQDETPGPGHNSAGAGLDDDPMFEDKPLTPTELGRILRDGVERIEELEKERSEVNDLIRDVYKVLKDNHGIDPKVLRKIVAIRKKDREQRETEDALLYNYMSALGML